MGMKEYYYDKALSDLKFLEEEYERILWKEDRVLSKNINKSVLTKIRNTNKK